MKLTINGIELNISPDANLASTLFDNTFRIARLDFGKWSILITMGTIYITPLTNVREVLAYRPKSKQPKPRKRKKAKRAHTRGM